MIHLYPAYCHSIIRSIIISQLISPFAPIIIGRIGVRVVDSQVAAESRDLGGP